MSQMCVFSPATTMAPRDRHTSGGRTHIRNPQVSTGEPISINVGGVLYTTSVQTVMKYPDSMLGRMFGGPIPTATDGGGSFFIDRDGKLFRHILNFLRNDKLVLPENFAELQQLKEEVDFYQITPMMKALSDFSAARDEAAELERVQARRRLESLADGQIVDVVEHNILDDINSAFGKTIQIYAPASILRCLPLQHEDLANVEKLVQVTQQTDYHPNRSADGPLWNLGKGYIEIQDINYLTRSEVGEIFRCFGCRLLQSSAAYSNASEVTNKNVMTILDKWFVPDDCMPELRDQSMARRALPPGRTVGFLDWNPNP